MLGAKIFSFLKLFKKLDMVNFPDKFYAITNCIHYPILIQRGINIYGTALHVYQKSTKSFLPAQNSSRKCFCY